MSSDKQDFGIKVVDHRGEGEGPEVTYHSFSNHKDFLNKVRELTATPPGTVVSEKTWTRLTITDAGQQQELLDQ